jgi:hypothetical protein
VPRTGTAAEAFGAVTASPATTANDVSVATIVRFMMRSKLSS